MQIKAPHTTRVREVLATLIFVSFLAIPLSAHQPHDPLLVVATSPNYQQDHTLLLATDYLTVSIGVYLPLMSTDGGNTLTPLRGIPNQPINSIQFSASYATDGTILMGGAAGLFRSNDRGATWTQVAVGAGASIQGIAFSHTFFTDGTVYVISPTGVYKSTDHAASFSAITTPALTGTLSSISASPNFSVDRKLALGGTSDGIFLSTDGGSSWTRQTSSLTLPQIQALVFTPGFSQDNTIFAATYGAGVYISTDGGLTWAASNSGITDLTVSSLITYPGYNKSGVLYISTATAGVFVSNNRGQSWTKAANVYRPLSNQTTEHYRTLAAGSTSSNTATLFLGMFEGMWMSTNKAQSWSYVELVPTYLLRELRISPTYPVDQTILGTSYGGGQLYSGDGGNTWSLRNSGAQNSYPDADAISPNYANDHTFAVGDLEGLELSRSSGAFWQTQPGLNASTYVRAIAFSPTFAQDSTLLIGTDNRGTGNPSTVTYQGNTYPNQGLFISTDGGVHWAPTSLGGPEIDNIVISPGFATDRTALAASSTFGLYQSTDGGATWTQVLNLASDPGILQVVMSPSFQTDRTAFATTPHSGIYKTVDAGTTWNQLPNSTPYTALNFAISPNFLSDRTMFVGTFQSGLIVSKDGGATYQPTGLTQNFITGLDISSGFVTDQTLFAATYRGVYKSVDGGVSWTFGNEPNRQENDRQVNVLYTGVWSKTSTTSASTDSLQTSTATGSTASVSFFGTSVSWIGLGGPHGGTASVSLDGVQVGTVSFLAAQTTYQKTIYQQSGLTCAPHTIVFTATSGTGQGISLDALDATRSGCGY